MLKKIRLFFRIIRINTVLIKHGLEQVVLSISIFKPVRFLIYLNPITWFEKKAKTDGERIRLVLEELGPVFVKFGQMLSTRGDIFSEDIIKELAKLQDKVPPFPGEIAKRIVEAELGDSVENIFAEFSIEPKASASVAQVHEVRLKGTYQHAVVKIIRPNIEKIINQDMELFYSIARILDKYWPAAKRLHPIEVVGEFDKIIHDELDLMREAANASQLRRNFQNSDKLYIPKIYWDYVSEKVMTMEYIEGIPISDIETLQANNIDLKELAERGADIFFTQVFHDCFFHADMHPGNIFVNPRKTEKPEYIAVDFGIVGTLNTADQYYLASNMLAFFQRDYRKVAELHVKSGWVAANTRVDEFESAIRTVCEPIFEKPLNEISFGKMLMRLFQIGRRFNMQVQPQLVLLQKTLLHVEGLGRQLYPELNLWESAKPFFEKWMKNQIGPKALLNKVIEKQPEWTRELPEIPELVYDMLSQFQRSKQQKEVETIKKAVSKWKYIFFGAGITLTFLTIFNAVWKQSLLHIYFNNELTFSLLAIVFFILSFFVRK